MSTYIQEYELFKAVIIHTGIMFLFIKCVEVKNIARTKKRQEAKRSLKILSCALFDRKNIAFLDTTIN